MIVSLLTERFFNGESEIHFGNPYKGGCGGWLCFIEKLYIALTGLNCRLDTDPALQAGLVDDGPLGLLSDIHRRGAGPTLCRRNSGSFQGAQIHYFIETIKWGSVERPDVIVSSFWLLRGRPGVPGRGGGSRRCR